MGAWENRNSKQLPSNFSTLPGPLLYNLECITANNALRISSNARSDCALQNLKSAVLGVPRGREPKKTQNPARRERPNPNEDVPQRVGRVGMRLLCERCLPWTDVARSSDGRSCFSGNILLTGGRHSILGPEQSSLSLRSVLAFVGIGPAACGMSTVLYTYIDRHCGAICGVGARSASGLAAG